MCLECHVVTIATKLKSLKAIKAACKRLGWTFKENQRTYEWVGRWYDDSQVPRHLFDSQEEYDHVVTLPRLKRIEYMQRILGKCDHAIGVPGGSGEIGLIERNGEYIPIWDWYASGLGNVRDSNGMDGFMQAYSAELCKLEAANKGYWTTEHKADNGHIKIKIGVLG